MPDLPTTTAPPGPADLRPLHPRVRVGWWIGGLLGTAVAAVPAVLAGVLLGGPVRVGAVVLVGVLLVAALVLPPLRYRRWRYAVRADDLWVREGVWWVTTTVVPYSRLQFVDTRQGPLDRVLGLASLHLYTAALGARTTIPGLAVDQAESLRERLADVEPDVVST